MAQLVDQKDLYVIVDYHLVGLLDEASSDGPKPPAPHTLGHWLSTTPGNVYLETDDTVLGADMRLQTWDGAADFDAADWQLNDLIVMELPTGVLSIDQITAGAQAAVYRLPAPGRWNARLAWRTNPAPDDQSLPRASVLVQFWAAEPA
jgi:hypothetical protein